MKKLFRKTTWMLIAFMSIMSSCDKQEPIEQSPQKPQDGDIAVGTEIIVDGENVTNTRAASEAGYTTGDGLYDSGDPVTVAAFANDGYELTAFYDKQYPDVNLGSSHTFPAKIPQTFKAEFARKFTISVSASPSDGGTVTGGGKYKNGTSCTLIATPKSGYTFDGWYEASSKLSSNSSYSFTVSSNRTMTARFTKNIPIEYVTVNISFANDWSGTVSMICAGNTIGDGYFSGTSGTIQIEKGSRIEINIESELSQSGTPIPTAYIDVIQLRPGGSVYNSYYTSFTANENTNVTIHCSYGYE